MKFSYISPRKKSIFTPDVKLVMLFFGMTLFMLFSTYSYLVLKNYNFSQNKIDIIQERENLKINIGVMNKEIAFTERENRLSMKIFTKNSVLKDSIANMFDLVPQRITLSEAKLLENGLILYGITPNKDVYNFMLQAPLRSIFHRTYSSFYPAENGWLRFVSTNFVDDEEPDTVQHNEEETKTKGIDYEN
jgi:hypothetical protein